jgi:hypothetical protein
MAMIRDGYEPVGNEGRATVAGIEYAIHLGWQDGRERLYVARVPEWGKVWTVDAPETVKPPGVDLSPYLLGDGRVYRLRYIIDGHEGEQTLQTQFHDGRGYQVKDCEYEEIWIDGDYIKRGIDTSPGDGLYYIQRQDAMTYGAIWCPRYMQPGQVYQRFPLVTFYRKSDCSKVGEPKEGYHRTWLRFAAHHAKWGGVSDVVELHWLLSPDAAEPAEVYFYGRGYGLVGWNGGAGSSWIAADGGDAPVMENIGCLRGRPNERVE